MSHLRLVILALSLAASNLTVGAKAACRPDLPLSGNATSTSATIGAEDLVRLRDIGVAGGAALDAPTPFTISPDGKRIAFQLRQADPDSNAYCLAIVVVDVDDATGARVVDRGGELIIRHTVRLNFPDLPLGVPETVVPHWSPDGTRLLYLRREGGITNAWMVGLDNGAAVQLTHDDIDVAGASWSQGGRAIVYADARPLLVDRKRIQTEGSTGYHYDDRWFPKMSNQPLPTGKLTLEFHTVDLATGVDRDADVEDSSALQRQITAELQGAGPVSATSASGLVASAQPASDSYSASSRLKIRRPSGELIGCPDAICDNVAGFWWLHGKDEILILRREGWARSRLGLYRYRPGAAIDTQLLETQAIISDCALLRTHLICGYEDALRPKRLIVIDTSDGSMGTFFDPNPELDRKTLGTVHRETWRNASGFECFGDVVLPPGVRRPRGLPLVVVQYSSEGFLRGGTGDEYPIQLLAAKGFVVLSFERPPDVASRARIADPLAFQRRNVQGWADRRSVESALEIEIRSLIRRHIVDPRRIGITGLSDGANTVAFELINSNIFSAAILSSCCEERHSLRPLAGPDFAQAYDKMGYPPASTVGAKAWIDYSLSANASRLHTPILMELASDEYLGALETYTALKQYHVPVSMYVFPDEHHIKSQPAHRLAIYERNVAWFEKWLRPVSFSEP